MSLKIQVNGAAHEVEDGTTVADLVAAHDLDPAQVAVELNRELVARDARADRVLTEGDRVELVTLVGGG